MRSRATISVLLPAFNAAGTIREALRSVVEQSLPPAEVIVVDDGSTDTTAAVVEEFAVHHRNVRLLRIPHQGIVAALNTGIEASSLPLIARMDADDISLPRRFELQAAFLEAHPDIQFCSGLVEFFPAEEMQDGMRRYQEWANTLVAHDEIAREIFVESPIPHPTVMMRRDTLLDLGGYRDRGWPEDYDLWLRAHEAGWRFGKVPEVVLRWRLGPDRLTLTDPRCSARNFLRAKAGFLARRLQRCRRPVVVRGAGRTGKLLTRELERHGLRVEAFMDIDPGKIGGRRLGRPVLGRDQLDRHPGCFVVVAVASLGARRIIRDEFTRMRLVEGKDFLCAA